MKEKNKYSQLFGNKSFTILWLSETISLIGDRILIIVLIAFVYSTTKSPLSVGGLMILKALPAVLFGSFAGVIVDRFSRKKIMIITNVIQGILILLIPIINSFYIIFIMFFLTSVAYQFFAPARIASIPDIVAKEDLMAANSLFAIVFVGAIAIGPGIAGFIIDKYGQNAALYMDSFTFFIPAVAVIFITLPQIRKKEKIGKMNIDLKEGFSYILKNKEILISFLFLMLAYLSIGILNVLGVILAYDVHNAGPKGFGLMMSCLGVGLLGGAIVLSRGSKKLNCMVMNICGAFVLGISLILLAVINLFSIVLVVCVFMGIGIILMQISSFTIIQSCNEEFRGRVMGVSQSVIGTTQFITMGITGVLAEYVSVIQILIFNGIFTFLVGLLVAIIINRKKLNPVIKSNLLK